MSASCPIHQPPNDFRGAASLRQMAEMGQAPFDSPVFSIEGDPIVEGNRLVVRWTTSGCFMGGLTRIIC
jgi:hypothetical protein